jgi:uncharacterized protein DUF4328
VNRPTPDELSTARRAERRLARWTTGFLLAFVALDVSAITLRLSQRSDIRALTLGTLVGTAIVWLAWLYRAYGNLTLVGSKRSRFGRIRAVGYWFIPFLNLVRPFQVMKDLWLRSESMNDRDGYDDLPAPGFLSAWWGVFLTRGVAALAVASLGPDGRTPGDLLEVGDLQVLVSLAGVAAAVLAIAVVRGIDRRQQCFQTTVPELPSAVARAAHTLPLRSVGSGARDSRTGRAESTLL